MNNTEEEWVKWRHPLDRHLPHPWVPSYPVPINTDDESPENVAIIERYSCETANFVELRFTFSFPRCPFELQDIPSNYTFSLKELHEFCGKASGMYAIADLRVNSYKNLSVKGLDDRIYGEWFKLVESDSYYETRFFARFMQTNGLSIADIVARHRALSLQLETQMREPIKRVIEGETASDADERLHHGKFTLLPTFKDLVIILEKESFRAHVLLFVLNPVLAEGIREMEGGEEDEIGGRKIIRVRAAMVDIMRAVVAMQKNVALIDNGITGCYRED